MAFTPATKIIKTYTRSGSGSPVGVVTPRNYGDVWIDEGVASYTAIGLTNADWVQQGGGVSSTAFSTYSPAYGFATTPATTWTYSTQNGRYKQLGNICFFMADVNATLTSKGSAAGYFYISLPVTVRASLQGFFAVLNQSASFTFPSSAVDLVLNPTSNTQRMTISASKSAATFELVDAGDFTEGQSYRFTAGGWYET